MDQLPGVGRVRQQVAHAVVLQGEGRGDLTWNAPGEDQIQILIGSNQPSNLSLSSACA